MYEIIRTSVSDTRKICYFIYKHNINLEDCIADTYGISAYNISECCSVDDVVTDKDESLRLLDAVSENSVPIGSLKDFVIDYIDRI